MRREDHRFNQQFFDTLLDKASATALVLLQVDTVLVNAGQISPAGLQTVSHAVSAYWQGFSTQFINRYAGLLIDTQYHLLLSNHSQLMMGILV